MFTTDDELLRLVVAFDKVSFKVDEFDAFSRIRGSVMSKRNGSRVVVMLSAVFAVKNGFVDWLVLVVVVVVVNNCKVELFELKMVDLDECNEANSVKIVKTRQN